MAILPDSAPAGPGAGSTVIASGRTATVASPSAVRRVGDFDLGLAQPHADLAGSQSAHVAARGVRLAHEAGEERRRRPLVEVARAALLLDAAGVHDDDAVRHRHRLLLVVRDVDHGEAEPLLQLADLLAHLAAQPRVEVADSGSSNSSTDGFEHQGARHGDALLLAARQLGRLALLEAFQPDLLSRPSRARASRLGLGAAPSGAGRRQTFSSTLMCGNRA